MMILWQKVLQYSWKFAAWSKCNLDCTVKTGGKEQTRSLNRNDRPSHFWISEEIVQSIKDDLTDTKQKIPKTITDNIEDQCDENTFYYCWTSFDLEKKLSLEICKNRMRYILSTFCSECAHMIQEFASPNHYKEEDPTVFDKWEGYKIHFQYPPKINCTEEEIIMKYSLVGRQLQSLSFEILLTLQYIPITFQWSLEL